MQHRDIVPLRAKSSHRRIDLVRVEEEIGDEHHHPTARDQGARSRECAGGIGALAPTRLLERGDDPMPLLLVRARRERGADLVIEADQAHGVALAEEDSRERRHEMRGVRRLGQARRRPLPVHRAAHIEDDRRAQVGLLLELLEEPAVGARGDLPIEKAEVIAGLVGPVLREFHGESFLRRAMQPLEESLR